MINKAFEEAVWPESRLPSPGFNIPPVAFLSCWGIVEKGEEKQEEEEERGQEGK